MGMTGTPGERICKPSTEAVSEMAGVMMPSASRAAQPSVVAYEGDVFFEQGRHLAVLAFLKINLVQVFVGRGVIREELDDAFELFLRHVGDVVFVVSPGDFHQDFRVVFVFAGSELVVGQGVANQAFCQVGVAEQDEAGRVFCVEVTGFEEIFNSLVVFRIAAIQVCLAGESENFGAFVVAG